MDITIQVGQKQLISKTYLNWPLFMSSPIRKRRIVYLVTDLYQYSLQFVPVNAGSNLLLQKPAFHVRLMIWQSMRQFIYNLNAGSAMEIAEGRMHGIQNVQDINGELRSYWKPQEVITYFFVLKSQLLKKNQPHIFLGKNVAILVHRFLQSSIGCPSISFPLCISIIKSELSFINSSFN